MVPTNRATCTLYVCVGGLSPKLNPRYCFLLSSHQHVRTHTHTNKTQLYTL